MLETCRLRLRPFSAEDRGSFIVWHTHAANRRFKWDGPLSIHDARRQFAEIIDATVAGDPTYLAIDLADTGETIGQVGLFPTAGSSELALAYLIDEPFWGHGYATEASRAVIDERLGHDARFRIVAVIPVNHVASERVASKLGLAPTRCETRNGMPVRRWEAPREMFSDDEG